MTTRKRARTSFDSAIADVWRREIGQISEGLVLGLDVLQKLDMPRGCVNTACFNEFGVILVSASYDRKIILWDW